MITGDEGGSEFGSPEPADTPIPGDTEAPLAGTCEPRFEAVRQAFAENFDRRGEIGAAVCVVVDGKRVVDLWGGWADAAQTTAWQADSLVNVFSVGKPLAALCLLRLVADGSVDLDAPVARYWPEFAAAGKADVTIRLLLSHQAGLPAVRDALPAGAMYDWTMMCDALAGQEPWWAPGTAHGYHVNTFGFLVGEVVRRVGGRSVGQVLHDDVTVPLAADFFVGLPPTELARIADFLWPESGTPAAPAPSSLTDEELMAHNAYFNPGGLSGAGVVNTREWRTAELPSTNAHASARGVARVFEPFAGGGEVDGIRVIDPALLREAVTEAVVGDDRVLKRPSRFGLGFQLTQPERPLGPNAGAFGHYGAGGSLGFADPDAGVAFGYVMSRLGPRWQNPLNRALVDAVYDSLA